MPCFPAWQVSLSATAAPWPYGDTWVVWVKASIYVVWFCHTSAEKKHDYEDPKETTPPLSQKQNFWATKPRHVTRCVFVDFDKPPKQIKNTGLLSLFWSWISKQHAFVFRTSDSSFTKDPFLSYRWKKNNTTSHTFGSKLFTSKTIKRHLSRKTCHFFFYILLHLQKLPQLLQLSQLLRSNQGRFHRIHHHPHPLKFRVWLSPCGLFPVRFPASFEAESSGPAPGVPGAVGTWGIQDGGGRVVCWRHLFLLEKTWNQKNMGKKHG